MSPAGRKGVTLAAEQAVDPSGVEDGLARLWRDAGRQLQRKTGGNVTRACLWNLVVYNPRTERGYRDRSGHGFGLRTLLDEVILSIPARVIRLEMAQDGRALPPGKGAEAWVAVKCLDTALGKRQIYGEEVNLKVRPKGGDSHFPSLVRALLQPNLPIALLGLAYLPGEGWILEQMLRLCDRIVVDTQNVERSSHPRMVHRFMEATDAYVVDIGWMRLTPVRYLLAGLFDSPAQTDKLKQVEKITVEATPSGRNVGLMLLGWFLSRCGYSKFQAAAARKQQNRSRWTTTRSRHRIEVELNIREGEGGADGLLGIEVLAGGSGFSVRQVDANHVSLHSPEGSDGNVALNGWSDSELVIAALGAQGVDPLFVEALKNTVSMLDVEG